MGGAFRILGGDDAGLYFRHGDHLGSTSVLSDSTGAKVDGSDVVYAPFGEIRSGDLSALTDFGFTGQRLDRSTGGLMYYRARYYLPGLRRFISADILVPGISNPQAFNRYAYVLNNSIRYSDPTGHRIASEYEQTGMGEQNWRVEHRLYYWWKLRSDYDVTIPLKELDKFDQGMQEQITTTVLNVVETIADRLSEGSGKEDKEAFTTLMGPQTFHLVTGEFKSWTNSKGKEVSGYCLPETTCWFGRNSTSGSGNSIEIVEQYFTSPFTINGITQSVTRLITHEFAHSLERRHNGDLSYEDSLNSNPLTIDGRLVSSDQVFDPGNRNTMIGVHSRSTSDDFERSTDIVASWILGEIYNPELYTHINNYMNAKMGW